MKDSSNFCLALGQIIREHREKRNWTRKILAAKTGISISHVRVIEMRQGNPSVGIDADKLLLEAMQRQAYLNDKNRLE